MAENSPMYNDAIAQVEKEKENYIRKSCFKFKRIE